MTVRFTCALLATVGISLAAQAQDAEPRSYSNAPVGLNFFVAGYAYTRGGISFDPALPIEDVRLQTNSGVLAYVHAFGIAGISAKVLRCRQNSLRRIATT